MTFCLNGSSSFFEKFVSSSFNGVLSKTETLRICVISFNDRSLLSLFFVKATNKYVQTEIQTWVLTAFWEYPQNVLIRRCCLTHLKNSSICQRYLYNRATSRASIKKLLVRKTRSKSFSAS